MTDWKLHFLRQSCLGRNTNLNDPKSVVLGCVKLAYRDMLTAGRFYLTSNINENCQYFVTLLETHRYQFSIRLIFDTALLFGEQEIIRNGNRYVTRFGLAQKLVTMTYKYLYVFSELLPFSIDFSKCECPLDSIILSKLSRTDVVWSKLDSVTYQECQRTIRSILADCRIDNELQCLGNLAFDFLSW